MIAPVSDPADAELADAVRAACPCVAANGPSMPLRPLATRRGALRLLGVGALAGLASVSALDALFDTAAAEAQDGPTRAALTRRFTDGHLALAPARLGALPGARVTGLVDAPFRHALGALLDFGSYDETFAPWLARLRVLSRARGHARLYAEVSLSRAVAPRWVELEARVEGVADGTHRVRITRTRGELPALDAQWQLVATPGRVRTLASVTLGFVSPLPLGADALAALNRDAARTAFSALRHAAPRRA
jgi:hypothetical protein